MEDDAEITKQMMLLKAELPCLGLAAYFPRWRIVGATALITANFLPRQAIFICERPSDIHRIAEIESPAIMFRKRGNSMAKPESLIEAVQRFGFAKAKKVKLYGKELELVSEPINQGDDVFIDAREKRTGQVKQVQVPRNIVEMAKSGTSRRK